MNLHLFRVRPILIATVIVTALSTCNSSREPVQPVIIETAPVIDPLQNLINLAERSGPAESGSILIEALELMLAQDDLEAASGLIRQLPDPQLLDENEQIRLALIQAELALIDDGNPQSAIRFLSDDWFTRLENHSDALQRRVYHLRALAFISSNQPFEAARELIDFNSRKLPNQVQSTHDLIWQALERLTLQELTELMRTANNFELRGWVELARIVHSEQVSVQNQIRAINRWSNTWAQHSAASMIPANLQNLVKVWEQRPKRIALLLPLQEPAGIAIQEGFLSAYYQEVSSGNDVPLLDVYDTSGLADINGMYDTAVESGAELIIGPLYKPLVQQLSDRPSLSVPTLALNYTDLPGRNSQNFFQLGLSPRDEILQAANLAWTAGLRNAAIVFPNIPDFVQLQQAFSEYWLELGGKVVANASFSDQSEYSALIKNLLAIDASEARARKIIGLLPRSEVEFVPRRRDDIDFIFLLGNPRQGRQIKPTLAFYFAGNIPVYALSGINDGSTNRLANQDLNGIIFPDTPWVLHQDDPFQQQVNETLGPVQGVLQRLRALGVDSFRLYPRLFQLDNGEISSLNGVTGLLTLTTFGSFRRSPPSATFVDGLVVLLDGDNTGN